MQDDDWTLRAFECVQRFVAQVFIGIAVKRILTRAHEFHARQRCDIRKAGSIATEGTQKHDVAQSNVFGLEKFHEQLIDVLQFARGALFTGGIGEHAWLATLA